MKSKILLFLGLLFGSAVLQAQRIDTLIYKNVGEVALEMAVHYPPDYEVGKLYPTAMFFFGGGWNSGNIGHFRPQAEYFARRGMICLLPEYRTKSKHNTDPFTALQDAKSAVRYALEHARKIGIDTSQLVLGGGSAGGHLAAAAVMTTEHNAPTDNLEITPKAAALILFNAVIDNGPAGYGYERIGAAYPSFSPLHNIKKGTPPTLFLLGTKDRLIPVETAHYYKMALERVGTPCELHLYEGAEHGFFNLRNPKYFENTLLTADWWLVELGILAEK